MAIKEVIVKPAKDSPTISLNSIKIANALSKVGAFNSSGQIKTLAGKPVKNSSIEKLIKHCESNELNITGEKELIYWLIKSKLSASLINNCNLLKKITASQKEPLDWIVID